MGSESRAKKLRREVLELQHHVATLGKLPPAEEEALVRLRESRAFRRAQVVSARKFDKQRRKAGGA